MHLSAARRALRVHIKRVERLAACHEEAIAAEPAEAEIGAALGQRDAADRLALRREDHDAVMALAHAPAGTQIALDIAAEPVWRTVLPGVDEDAPVGEPRAVVDDVVEADDAG